MKKILFFLLLSPFIGTSQFNPVFFTSISSSLEPKTVAYYKFNNNSNSVLNSLNGTDNNGVTYVTGKINQAANYNSTNRNTTVADSDFFSFTNGSADVPFSINLWINVAENANTQYIISKRDAAATNIEYQLNYSFASGVITFGMAFFSGNTTANFFSATTNSLSMTPSTWNMVTVTYNGNGSYTGFKLYLNGNAATISLGGSGGTYVAMSNTSAIVTIGNVQGSLTDRFLRGSMDELGIWKDRVLNQNEINQLYNSTSGITYPF